MLRTVTTFNILLLLYRTITAAAVGTVTASSKQQNEIRPTIAQDAFDATSLKAFSPHAARQSRAVEAPAARSCARCEGPWQTDFVHMLRANLFSQLTDEGRAWPLKGFTELTDAVLAVRMREMFIANELPGDRQLLMFWVNFEVVEMEETRLFYEHFEKNISSPTTKRVFHEMRRILYNRTLSEYEKCATITTILRAHDESCRELRQQQPYKTQVMTQRPFGPIAPSFILASVEEVERARAVDIWLNATTRFHAPLREMAADFTAWQRRQSMGVSGSGVWARQQIADAKLLSSSQDIDGVLDRTLATFLFDGDETGAQVCRRLIDLLAQLDESLNENKFIATLRYSTARCGASSGNSAGASGGNDDDDDDGGARRFLRTHFLHGASRFHSALSFESLLTLSHHFRDEREFLNARKI